MSPAQFMARIEAAANVEDPRRKAALMMGLMALCLYANGFGTGVERIQQLIGEKIL